MRVCVAVSGKGPSGAWPRARVIRTAQRVGFALYVVLGIALVVPALVARISPSTAAASSPSATIATPTLAPTAAVTASPSATAPTPSPTPAPSATPAPIDARAYVSSGRTFAALSIRPLPYTFGAPMAGRVSIVTYQFLGGEVRIGSNVPSEPFFPYVMITSADRRLTLRPGALGTDVQLVAKDGQTVAVGDPLFIVVGRGASSWRTFYDRALTDQVIASLAVLPSGVEIDPLPLFRR